MFTNLKVSQLKNHPKNLRKEYQEIDELAKSIQAQGIKQPLLVVPEKDEDGNDIDDSYLVVAGNRRLRGAIKAGLGDVPCIIDYEMLESEQIEVMVVENMQRSNLTPVEEAKGIQMMFDFGWDAEKISEKTGLSESTVYRRKKIAELDTDRIKGQATIGDFAKLEKIKSIDRRNELLEYIGQDNFESKLREARDEEDTEEKYEKFRIAFDGWAEEVTSIDYSQYKFVRSYSRPQDVGVLDGEGYIFELSRWNVCLYQDKQLIEGFETEEENEEEAAEREKRADEKRKHKEKVKALVKESRERRGEAFMHGARPMSRQEKLTLFIDTVFKNGIQRHLVDENIKLLFGEDYDCDSIGEKPMIDAHLEGLIWCIIDKGDPTDWDDEYMESDWHKNVLDMAEKMGVELSEGDKALLDGTHEVYKELGEDEDDE